jgi:hypothetical protein
MDRSTDGGDVLRIAGLLAVLLLAATSAGLCEELYYYLEDGHIVITNTPSRSDVQVVPGFEERVIHAMRGELPATPWDRSIHLLANTHGLTPELIKAVALVESNLDPGAVSPKGALGLMQLMPDTAKSLGVEDPLDPEQSLAGGARYLRSLLDRFDGDLNLALAAYNAGPGTVRRHGGVPGYPETRSYVRRVREKLGTARTPRPGSGVPGDEDEGSLAWKRLPDGTLLLSN